MKRLTQFMAFLLVLGLTLSACGGNTGVTEPQSIETVKATEASTETVPAPTEATTEPATEPTTEAPTEPQTEAAPVKPEKTGPVSATGTELVQLGKIWGRVMDDKGRLTLDWPASGVEFNAWFTAAELKIKVKVSSSAEALIVFVDGEETAKSFLTPDQEAMTVAVSEGYHNIRILKESITSNQCIRLVGVEFQGAFMNRPEEKALFIEVIGDSYACGSGSVGTFTLGKAWSKEDHSGTHSFAWYLAEKLDADLSVVARGGIGAVKEGGGYNMRQVYNYSAGLRTQSPDTLFKPERTPDIVILELGANDSCPVSEYKDAIKEMVGMIRTMYGTEPWIVWAGRNEAQLAAWKILIKDMPEDTKLSFASYAFAGKGAAALATQTSGHPNAAEAQTMADSIIKAMVKNGIVAEP